MAEKRGYGVGLQTFADMIKRECVYVDKTAYVYKMAHSKGKNFFLSRPRRFGKSLLVTTLQAYFEGRKELFKGLAIEKLEKEWTVYPVIHLDLSNGKYYDETSVDDICGGLLRSYEEDYGLPVREDWKLSDRLTKIIKTAYERTQREVVILIDEYDAPMLDSIHDTKLQDHLRQRVRDLFSPLKAQEKFLKFVFLTGISKFSQLSVFSELNNLNILTFDPEYEGVCGITEEELLTHLKPDIEWLAEAMSRRVRRTFTYDDTVAKLKHMYDGYHFTDMMTDIYNPWSLIYAFEKGWIDNYWFGTGTPSSLINLLRVKQLVIPELEGFEADKDTFDAPTERISDPVPVLFQSGYLTIKGYDYEDNTFTLGFPNEEVYRSFSKSLYNYYCEEYVGSRNQMNNVFRDLRRKRISFEQFLESVRKWYAGIPYSITDKNQNEQFYQALFYSLMVGVGADVSAEEQTSDGRMDIALKMPDAIYILEFKFNKTAAVGTDPEPARNAGEMPALPKAVGAGIEQARNAGETPALPKAIGAGPVPARKATEQILTKNYAVRFAADARPVWAVGLNISADRRTIESYEVVKVKD